MKILIATFLIFLSACATKPKATTPARFTSWSCQENFKAAILEGSADQQLNRISDMFVSGCYREVISLGTYVRDFNRDKIYNVTAEVAELTLPEGTLTEYVLESYERSYLSLLISLSYMNLGDKEATLVELRRSIMDENARLYNHGNDPVITLLQATIWYNLEPATSRPFWQRLSEEKNLSASVKEFYKRRLDEIDQNKIPEEKWKILGYGSFPQLEWKSDLAKRKKGPFIIQATDEFPKSCATESTLLIPTTSWVEKISRRYEHDYHPILYAKSLARMPFGFVYGVVGVTSGVALGAGGCVLASYIRSEQACSASIQGAAYVIKKTGNLVEYTVGPDLRHWEKVPTAFYIVRETTQPGGAKCLSEELMKYTEIKKLWK